MNSPLILPVTLIIAGVLAFMATTGILPPVMFRLWPVLFVVLGIVGLLSLSSEELENEPKKAAPKKSASAKKVVVAAKPAAKKSAPKKTVKKAVKSAAKKSK
jgi:hypothetical protein